MSYISAYLTDLKSHKADIDEMFAMKMVDSLPEIRKWIKERWLLGDRPDGSVIGVYRGAGYSMFKYQMNPSAGGDVDLTLTGAMGDNIEIKDSGDLDFELFSTVPYYEDIIEKYGDYNFNISDERQEALLSKIGAEVIYEIFDKIWRA